MYTEFFLIFQGKGYYTWIQSSHYDKLLMKTNNKLLFTFMEKHRVEMKLTEVNMIWQLDDSAELISVTLNEKKAYLGAKPRYLILNRSFSFLLKYVKEMTISKWISHLL